MESNLEITNAELADIVSGRSGCQVFREALEKIGTGEDLMSSLGRYVSFNSVFGSGVAILSAQIRLREDLFRDSDEGVEPASTKVAASIFFAAIAEFGDRKHINHRTLALVTMRGVASFCGFNTAALDLTLDKNNSTRIMMRRVLDGYGVNQPLDEQHLFSSIGFHIASEMLADDEFNLLDQFLKAKYPRLVDYLKNMKIDISGIKSQAYDWIQIHTTVEADHSSAALAGANLALRYYAGDRSTAEVKGWILDGFREFADLQIDFLRGLSDA